MTQRVWTPAATVLSLATMMACSGSDPIPTESATTGGTTGGTTAGTTGGTTTGTTPGGTSASLAIAGFDCKIAGVNASPFTIATALASKAKDHELASDYTYAASAVVPIVLTGTSATVTGSGATVSGSTVTITAAGTYSVSGTLTNGQLVVNTKDTAAVRIILNGATIANASNSAIFVSKAAKAVILLADGTTSRVSDGATYPSGVDQNAAIFSKGNLSIGGGGALVVTGNFEDGLTSKDGLVIKSGTITVTAKDDGIRGKDYLVIRGGTFDVTSAGDALKADEEGDATLGYLHVQGGTFKLTTTAGDAVSAETDALIAGGTFTIKAGTAGSTRAVTDTSLSVKGLKAGRALVVDGGTLTIDASDDALHSNGRLIVNGGTMTLATADDGVHADSALTINAGTITITKSYEGIENGFADMVFNGGDIRVTSSDDGVNLSGAGDTAPGGMGGGAAGGTTAASRYTMRINGGRLAVNATGDGLDANGSMVMTGGCAVVQGPTANNNASLDYDGTFQITGGLLVASGSSGMAQQPGTTSTQPSVMLSFASAKAAGTMVHLQSSTGEALLDFMPSKAFQTFVFSSPSLKNGGSYSVYTGGSATSTASEGWFTSGTYSGGALLKSFTLSGVASRVSL